MNKYIKIASLITVALVANIAVCESKKKNQSPIINTLLIKDMSVRDLARLMTETCNCPIICSSKVANITVNAYLQNIRCEDALKAICSSNSLWYKKDDETNIIQLMTFDEFKKGANLNTQDRVEIIKLSYPRVEEIGEVIARLYGNRVVWSQPDKDISDPSYQIDQALNRMDQLAKRGSYGGEQSNTNSSNSNNNSQNTSNNNQTTDPHQTSNYQRPTTADIQQETLISKLKNSKQSLAELTGRPDIVYISALPSSNDLLLRSEDPNSLRQIKQIIKRLDKPVPQVLLEVKVLEVSLDDGKSRAVDWLFQGGPSGNRSRFSGGSSRGITNTAGQEILTPTATLVPQGSGTDARAMIFNFVNDDLRTRLQLLETEERISQLATPNLIVADNEASRIFVGQESTLLKHVDVQTTTRGDNNQIQDVIYTPETDRIKTGTTLLFTPKIHPDGTVTIRILQENSEIGETREIQFGGSATDKFITTDVNERSVTTTVIAPDGKFVAIGGLVSEKVADDETGIPFLKDIPYLGSLFKSTKKIKQRTELMILLRPFILLAPGDAEDISMELLERNSQHPSANKDFPNLGISKKSEYPVGKHFINKKQHNNIKRKFQIWKMEGNN